MKRKVLALAILLILLLSALGLPFEWGSKANFFPIPVPSPAIVITSDGGVDPSTAPIQRSGDTYTLTADIDGYTIAIERDYVVLDGAGYTIRGKGNSTGIFVKNRHGVTIKNIRVTNFTYGIELFAEQFMGETSSDNTLSGNIVENNEIGIYISGSFNNVLRNNQMNNNKNNFWIKGGYVSETQTGYANDIDTSNTVNGKPIIYWIGQSNRTVPSNAGFVALINCSGIKAQNLDITCNGFGIVLVATVNSQMMKNHVAECDTGIYLYNCQDIFLGENIVENNGEGISVQTSSAITVTLNTITENRIGFNAMSSSKSVIADNVIANSAEAGINLQGGQNLTIQRNLVVDNNKTGINIFDSKGNAVVSNAIKGTAGNGIKLWFHAIGNKVLYNDVEANGVGILIADAYENKLIGNNLKENNGWGLRLEGSQNNNEIYQNNFINNKADGLQVSIPGIWSMEGMKPGSGNVWDNGKAGNYWSDYTQRYTNASEIGSSGIGDTPYYINENNIDRYPLMRPAIAGSDGEAADSAENHGWTTFRANAWRNGYYEGDAPENNQVLWKFKTGGTVISSPVAADGIVYVSSTDGCLYAINAASGNEIWKAYLGSGISSPTVASGKVFVTCEIGDIIALDAQSGTQVWRKPLGEEVGFGAPLVVGSRIFVNGKRNVHVFNTEVGANLYTEEVNMHGSGGVSPLAYDGNLILALIATGAVMGCNSFEAADGYRRFWVTLGPSSVDLIKSGPAVSDGKIFAVNISPEGCSTVYALEEFGMSVWNQPLEGTTEASPAVAYGLLYIPTDKYAYALNASNGAIVWSRPVYGEYSISSPAVAEGKVFFGLDNGYIYALDAYNGDLIWEYKTGGAVQSSPAIFNGLLFVGSNDGYLYAIGQQPETSPENSKQETFSIDPQYLVAAVIIASLAVYLTKIRKNRHLSQLRHNLRSVKRHN